MSALTEQPKNAIRLNPEVGSANESFEPFPSEKPQSPGIATPASSTAQSSDINSILNRIDTLSKSMSVRMQSSMREINQINLQTKVLSLNAQIEAARAGTVGQAFGVVAAEMRNLSELTAGAVGKLQEESQGNCDNISQTFKTLGTDIRATRLSDLAMTNMDIIDRNLYERSCDVRWWATDSSVVDALTLGTPEAQEFASKRLGVILDAYTVYFDIVVCDMEGKIIANGRPARFNCQGASQKNAAWFQAALATRNGSEFGFQSVHKSQSLANGAHILVYSCTIRSGGEANGQPIGVLGIVFNWEALAQTIVHNTLISPEEKPFTRTCIVDSEGTVLADTSNQLLTDKLKLQDQQTLFAIKKGHLVRDFNGKPHILAHALSPGYETYATGWHSLILQRVNTSR